MVAKTHDIGELFMLRNVSTGKCIQHVGVEDGILKVEFVRIRDYFAQNI